MTGIEAAYRGRMKMLKAIFGSSEEVPAETKPSPRPITTKLFDALFSRKR